MVIITIKKYEIHFKLYGTIVVTGQNQQTALNKAHRMSMKELVRNAKALDKESIGHWDADRIISKRKRF